MRKYLGAGGYVVLYLSLWYGICAGMTKLWLEGLNLGDFPLKYPYFSELLAMIVILLSYSLVFQFRKKDLVFACSFAKLDRKKIVVAICVGLLMGFYTVFFCNTGLASGRLAFFQRFFTGHLQGNSIFMIYLMVTGMTIVLEEMIFRGIIFNEIRGVFKIYPAVLIAALAYALTGLFTVGIVYAVYAFMAGLFFTLAYVYLRSLLAPVILQAANIGIMTILLETGWWENLRRLGNGVLSLLVLATGIGILVIFYFWGRDYHRRQTGKKGSLPV